MDSEKSPLSESRGVALVTGGSGGLGSEIASLLDDRGYTVAIHYNTGHDRAKAIQSRLMHPSLIIGADLLEWHQVARMEIEIRQSLGPVDVLINAAGIRSDHLMASQSPAEWRHQIDVNLIGTFHATRAVVPRMLNRRQGKIINIVSPAGLIASPGQTAYSAAKAGVIAMTRSLAYECGRRGVTVNALSPGFMETNLTKDVPPTIRDLILLRVPLRRITTPHEVAQAINFVLDSPYVTGQVISIDGGLTI